MSFKPGFNGGTGARQDTSLFSVNKTNNLYESKEKIQLIIKHDFSKDFL